MPAGGGCAWSRRPSPVAPEHPLVPVLRGVGASCCPGRLNFHCHTICSDGSLQPEGLADQAVDLGLEHFAVTDHHSVAALAPLRRRLALHRERGLGVPTLWSGVEISCLLEGCLVHVLGLGFDPDHPALGPYLEGSAVVGKALRAGAVRRAIHAAGGLALLAHPARYRLPYHLLIAAAAELGFDGAEAFYDYEQGQRWRPSPLVCDAIAAQLSRLGLLTSCGTDTHGLGLGGR
ncbi:MULTISPECIES: PHP domain-containing protein [unclassified Synechococcus]|uniref:PHP domain-containing protein n=1 Tax=Synechococcales TaxID=1890424 RepID=UPI0016296F92|nr:MULTISPECIES: PHP domain-containing protein [unclassified Synechococcus]